MKCPKTEDFFNCDVVTLIVNKPEKTVDLEDLKWFVYHEKNELYIDDTGEWCIDIFSPCECYDPKVCKKVNDKNKDREVITVEKLDAIMIEKMQQDMKKSMVKNEPKVKKKRRKKKQSKLQNFMQ